MFGKTFPGVLATLALSLATLGTAGCSSSAPLQEERSEARAELAAHRAQELARLHDYAQAGAFPVNTTVAPTGHFFRDDDGHLCAVANLVHQDGRDDLVNAVVASNNALLVADVHDGALYDWILSSGLTQEELTHIQRPAPILQRPPVAPAPIAVKPAPSPLPKPTVVATHEEPLPTESEMRQALQAQLASIEAELTNDTDASLDVAVDRVLAARHHA